MQRTIPQYDGHWLFKAFPEISKDIFGFSKAKTHEFGDTFIANVGVAKLCFTSNPDLIKGVLQTHQKKYKKTIAYEQMKQGLGNGLVTSEGDFWRRQRRLAQPAFYKKNLESLYQSMLKMTGDYLTTLEDKRGEVVDISEEMMQVTANIVTKSLFSTQVNNLHDIYTAMTEMQGYIMTRVRNPFITPWTYVNGSRRRFKKYMKTFDNMVYSMIDERKQSKEQPMDLMNLLLSAEDAETGERMTARQLRDEVITLFSAGHETSANALAWTFMLLSKHPEIVQKIRKEANAVFTKDSLPTFHDLRRLQYTKQVVEEGMRLYPPAWVIGRHALEEHEIAGFRIEKGLNILCQVHLLHRHPDLWKDPNDFQPDRFAPEKVKNRPKSHYIPFGAGPRMCIGYQFAMMEMQLLMATIVQRFDFELIKNQEIKLDPLITLRPKFGIKMKIV